MRTPEPSGGALRRALEEEKLDLEFVALDVDDSTSVATAVGGVIERSGRIDVLVNNAGLGKLTSVEGVPVEDAKAVFETNTFGPLRMMQAVASGDARAEGRHDRERLFGCGPHRKCRPRHLRREQVRPGSPE